MFTELTRRLRRRLRRDDRGVTAVEAAIIVPVLLLLVLGVFEISLALKDQLAITSSVRAGARIAAAEPRYANFAADAADAVGREGSSLDMSGVDGLWVYQADASGHPIGAGGAFGSCSTNCVKFAWSPAAKKFVPAGGSWVATSQNACQGEQDSVGVYLRIKHSAVTSLIFSSLDLDSYTVMRLEPIPAINAGGCK